MMKATANNGQLKQLQYESDHFSSDDVDDWIDIALTFKKTLKSLHLGDIGSKFTTYRAISSRLDEFPSLTHLSIQQQPFNKYSLPEFDEMIEKCPRLDIVSVQTLPKEHQAFLDDDTEDSTAAAASKVTTLRSLSQVKPRPEIKHFGDTLDYLAVIQSSSTLCTNSRILMLFIWWIMVSDTKVNKLK